MFGKNGAENLMHGTINHGLQAFVQEIYGQEKWEEVRILADLHVRHFEPMLVYDDLLTEQMLDAISEQTNRTRAEILEDFGTFLVAEHSSPLVRRLLRLGGENFTEFLFSLEDVHDRLSMVLPDLDLPILELEIIAPNEFALRCSFNKLRYAEVFLGLLRAMADDYGSLILIEHFGRVEEGISEDVFNIKVVKDDWNADSDKLMAAAQ